MQPAERILRSELCASAKAEWVKEKLHTLQQGAGATQSWNDRQKAEQLLGALLFSDLNIIGAPALPANVKDMHKEVLTGKYVLQVDEALDTAASARDRYRPGGGQSFRRCLKLVLTDGCQQVMGMEYSPLKDIPTDHPAGFKVVLSNVPIRRGLLLLQPGNCRLLGGQVGRLEEARQKALAALNAPIVGRPSGIVRDVYAEARAAAWAAGRPPAALQLTAPHDPAPAPGALHGAAGGSNAARPAAAGGGGVVLPAPQGLLWPPATTQAAPGSAAAHGHFPLGPQDQAGSWQARGQGQAPGPGPGQGAGQGLGPGAGVGSWPQQHVNAQSTQQNAPGHRPAQPASWQPPGQPASWQQQMSLQQQPPMQQQAVPVWEPPGAAAARAHGTGSTCPGPGLPALYPRPGGLAAAQAGIFTPWQPPAPGPSNTGQQQQWRGAVHVPEVIMIDDDDDDHMHEEQEEEEEEDDFDAGLYDALEAPQQRPMGQPSARPAPAALNTHVAVHQPPAAAAVAAAAMARAHSAAPLGPPGPLGMDARAVNMQQQAVPTSSEQRPIATISSGYSTGMATGGEVSNTWGPPNSIVSTSQATAGGSMIAMGRALHSGMPEDRDTRNLAAGIGQPPPGQHQAVAMHLDVQRTDVQRSQSAQACAPLQALDANAQVPSDSAVHPQPASFHNGSLCTHAAPGQPHVHALPEASCALMQASQRDTFGRRVGVLQLGKDGKLALTAPCRAQPKQTLGSSASAMQAAAPFASDALVPPAAESVSAAAAGCAMSAASGSESTSAGPSTSMAPCQQAFQPLPQAPQTSSSSLQPGAQGATAAGQTSSPSGSTTPGMRLVPGRGAGMLGADGAWEPHTSAMDHAAPDIALMSPPGATEHAPGAGAGTMEHAEQQASIPDSISLITPSPAGALHPTPHWHPTPPQCMSQQGMQASDGRVEGLPMDELQGALHAPAANGVRPQQHHHPRPEQQAPQQGAGGQYQHLQGKLEQQPQHQLQQPQHHTEQRELLLSPQLGLIGPPHSTSKQDTAPTAPYPTLDEPYQDALVQATLMLNEDVPGQGKPDQDPGLVTYIPETVPDLDLIPSSQPEMDTPRDASHAVQHAVHYTDHDANQDMQYMPQTHAGAVGPVQDAECIGLLMLCEHAQLLQHQLQWPLIIDAAATFNQVKSDSEVEIEDGTAMVGAQYDPAFMAACAGVDWDLCKTLTHSQDMDQRSQAHAMHGALSAFLQRFMGLMQLQYDGPDCVPQIVNLSTCPLEAMRAFHESHVSQFMD